MHSNISNHSFHNRKHARRVSTTSAALAIVLVFVWSGSSSAAWITLRDTAEVTGGVICLGDVADVRDADDAVAARLAGVTLAPAPAAGKSIRLEYDTIRSRVVSQGFGLTELEFAGSSVVKVTAVAGAAKRRNPLLPGLSDLAQRRIADLVSRAVGRYVCERDPGLGNVRVDAVLSDQQEELLNTATSAKLEVSGGRAPWSGDQTFTIIFFDRQGKKQELSLSCRVAALPRVLVPRYHLPKGHLVRVDDVTWKQLETASNVPFVNRTELIVGQETSRSLRAGEPIALADIRGVPLIRRGDIVTVTARNQGIVVRMEAKAAGDGSLGQQVKLVSLDGRRELVARVAGFHEAVVTPGTGDETPPVGTGTGVRLLTRDK